MNLQEKVAVTYLDEKFLDQNGYPYVLPAAEYQSVPHSDLRQWCVQNAFYALPTYELLKWLRVEGIRGRDAIEIGSGNNGLALALGIPATDSYVQQEPLMKQYYELLRQKPTAPPRDVLKMDALEAIDAMRPQVVVASWLTRKFMPDDVDGQAQASIYGVEEEEILKRVETYIHIGNEAVHGEKTLLKQPHRVIHYPWIVSRAILPQLNCIYVWDRD